MYLDWNLLVLGRGLGTKVKRNGQVVRLRLQVPVPFQFHFGSSPASPASPAGGRAGAGVQSMLGLAPACGVCVGTCVHVSFPGPARA